MNGGDRMLSEEVLKHVGIKGMKWGVRRDRNRPGGADGKEESTKIKDKRGKLAKTLDSMKRERQWKTVLKDIDKLSTKDITTIAKRVSLENNLKSLSKSKIATKKDKEDYLRRDKMSSDELSRKVIRLRAKENLYKTVRDASKEQREFGQKVVDIGSSLGIKYAVTRTRITPQDIFKAVADPKKASKEAKELGLKKLGVEDDKIDGILKKLDSSKS